MFRRGDGVEVQPFLSGAGSPGDQLGDSQLVEGVRRRDAGPVVPNAPERYVGGRGDRERQLRAVEGPVGMADDPEDRRRHQVLAMRPGGPHPIHDLPDELIGGVVQVPGVTDAGEVRDGHDEAGPGEHRRQSRPLRVVELCGAASPVEEHHQRKVSRTGEEGRALRGTVEARIIDAQVCGSAHAGVVVGVPVEDRRQDVRPPADGRVVVAWLAGRGRIARSAGGEQVPSHSSSDAPRERLLDRLAPIDRSSIHYPPSLRS